MTHVHFWFDPSCSFSWVTARWMMRVAEVRPVTPHWHLMSLAVLHEGREVSEGYRAFLRTAWGPVRVLAAAGAEHGDEVVLPLYTAMATRFYNEAQPRDDATVSAALAATGLPAALVGAMDSDVYDDRVRSSHQRAVDLVGSDVGTPTVGIGDTGFFGPVLTRCPEADEAGRVWDAVVALAGCRDFHELKRTRDRELDFS